MSIITKVTNFINEAQADGLELEMLRKQAALNSPINQWYRLFNEAGCHVGFSWICSCGIEYQLLSIEQWQARDHNCPTCKRPFSLFKALGITQETPHSKLADKYASLPVRSRTTGKKAPRFLDTWDSSKAGEVEYEMYKG